MKIDKQTFKKYNLHVYVYVNCMEKIEKVWWHKLTKVDYKQKEIFDILSIDKKAQEIDSMKDFYSLSELQKENYNSKVEFIDSEWFEEMRALEKDEKFSLQKEWLNEDELKKYTSQINKLIIKNVLLQKLDLTYKKFELMWWNKYQNQILESCKVNSLNYLNEVFKSTNVDNKKLRKCAKISRGETFLFKSSQSNDKCIWLELKKVWNRKDVAVLQWQKYFLQRHIDDGANISDMSDVLLQWKNLFDFYLENKWVRYIVSSSWLFDDEFNKFWMKKKKKEWNLEIPNRIKIRQESLNYGWILPSWESEEDIEKFLNWKKNSMTRAIEKYQKEWKEIKEGKWYIDLQKLQNWKLSQK
jgi:hypothetical protein